MTVTTLRPTADEIARFIRMELARKLNIEEAEIDQDTPFVDLGMSSRDAIALIGRLEDQLGLDIEPSIAWDHPTIAAMSGHLVAVAANR